MIELERHIEILLLSHDCIIVPGLGGFMTHHVAARYDDHEGLFLPPLRTLGFNPQLQLNDHLLAQSYIEAYDISYPEALHRIEEEVAELRQHLETKGCYELNDIGTLKLNDEGNMEFEPCEAGILTPTLYGLSSIEMPYLADVAVAASLVHDEQHHKHVSITNAEVKRGKEADNENDYDSDTTIIVKMSWLRNAVAIAAAILAFFFISSPVGNDELLTSVQQSSVLPIGVKSDVPAPTPSSQAEEIPTEEANLTAENDAVTDTPQQTIAEPAYAIVLASQTSTRNAEDFISRLAKSGYDDARTMAMSHSKYVRVVYGSYPTAELAHEHLRQLRQANKTFAEAWVLEVSE